MAGYRPMFGPAEMALASKLRGDGPQGRRHVSTLVSAVGYETPFILSSPEHEPQGRRAALFAAAVRKFKAPITNNKLAPLQQQVAWVMYYQETAIVLASLPTARGRSLSQNQYGLYALFITPL